MKILVTAGPTREFIDPVRFISNRSSGKMGYAIAGAAVRRGHEVVLVSGPVSLAPPPGLTMIRVVSAAEMQSAVEKNVFACDALVMAAAVSDWRPARVHVNKMKKRNSPATLDLEPVPDILLGLAAGKGDRIFVGFAAETENLLDEARAKLEKKNLDMIVANDVSRADAGFEVDTNAVTFIPALGEALTLPLLSKDDVAERLVQWIEAFRK